MLKKKEKKEKKEKKQCFTALRAVFKASEDPGQQS